MRYESIIKKLANALPAERILSAEPMFSHTSFRAGGPADLFLKVETEEELMAVLKMLKEEGIPYFLLGRGTNLLVGDGGYRGAIITMQGKLSECKVDGELVEAGAGCSLARIAAAAYGESLTGLEFAAGIPGSVGGAIVMNAGAYGGEMKMVVESVRILTANGKVKNLTTEEAGFRYRGSIIKDTKAIVLSARFLLAKGERKDIEERMKDLATRRMDKQPLEFASAGSTFKRPEGHFAGKLIEDAGLRGFSVGEAQVSEKHCGFVINRGGASAREILDVIEAVQAKVKEDSGILLEKEVILLGEF